MAEERTYHYTAGQEETTSLNEWSSRAEVQYLSEAELKAVFDADKTLQSTFESYDNYLGYMNDRQDLIDNEGYNPDWWANEDIPMYQETVFVMEDGSKIPASEYDPSMGQPVSMEGDIPSATGGGSNVEISHTLQQWHDQSDLLAESFAKYATGADDPGGSGFQHTAKDNNIYNWNGSSWVKTKSQDTTNWAGIAIKGAFAAAFSVLAGPQIGAAMGLTGSAAAAAGAAVTSLATQAITTGDLDPKAALISAALAYGGSELGKFMEEATKTGGTLADINSGIESFIDTVSGGSSIAEAAIKAGGISSLTQLITTGEVDMKTALVAAALAGGAEALKPFMADLKEMFGATDEDFETWVAEDDELQQAFIDADVKDPFLNPNYTSVGDGLMIGEDGNVYNYDGETVGSMDDLDINADGTINADDLEFVDPTGEYLPDSPDFIDENGNVVNEDYFLPPANTTNPDALTQEWKDERYGGMSEAQIRTQMERDGFTDTEIGDYISTLPEVDIADPNVINYPGGIIERADQAYTVNVRDGQNILVVDGKMTVISDDLADQLDLLDDAAALELIAQETGGGFVAGGFDENGRPNPQWTEDTENWLTLSDGTAGATQVDDFIDGSTIESQQPPPEPVDVTEQPDNTTQDNTSAPNPVNNETVDETLAGSDGSGAPAAPNDSPVNNTVPGIEAGGTIQGGMTVTEVIQAAVAAGATTQEEINQAIQDAVAGGQISDGSQNTTDGGMMGGANTSDQDGTTTNETNQGTSETVDEGDTSVESGYADGDVMQWDDMTKAQQNAKAVYDFHTTGQAGNWYNNMSAEEKAAAYEYLASDGSAATYGEQDGITFDGSSGGGTADGTSDSTADDDPVDAVAEEPQTEGETEQEGSNVDESSDGGGLTFGGGSSSGGSSSSGGQNSDEQGTSGTDEGDGNGGDNEDGETTGTGDGTDVGNGGEDDGLGQDDEGEGSPGVGDGPGGSGGGGTGGGMMGGGDGGFNPFSADLSYAPMQVTRATILPQTNYLDELSMLTGRLMK